MQLLGESSNIYSFNEAEGHALLQPARLFSMSHYLHYKFAVNLSQHESRNLKLKLAFSHGQNLPNIAPLHLRFCSKLLRSKPDRLQATDPLKLHAGAFPLNGIFLRVQRDLSSPFPAPFTVLTRVFPALLLALHWAFSQPSLLVVSLLFHFFFWHFRLEFGLAPTVSFLLERRMR